MYAPIVEFDTPAGKQRMVGRVRSNVPDYRGGQRVDMLYPPGAPAAAVSDDFWQQWLLVVVLAPMALAFGGVGAGFGSYFWRRRRLFRWLDRFGLRGRMPCLGAKVDTSISSCLKHPWRVTCEWRDPTTMQVYRMQSDPVWPDPRPRIEGLLLDVLLTPATPRQYRVNVDHLSCVEPTPTRLRLLSRQPGQSPRRRLNLTASGLRNTTLRAALAAVLVIGRDQPVYVRLVSVSIALFAEQG